MKRLLIWIISIVTIIIPIKVSASGSITVNTSNLKLTSGSSSTFTITASNAVGKVNISVANSNIVTVNKSSEWLDNNSVTVTVNAVGVGSTSIKVTLEDAATYDEEVLSNSYNINITVSEKASSNNYLSSLSISPLSLSFNQNTTSYTINAEHNIESINVVAKASDSKSSVSGTGTKSLKDYKNAFNIVVTAQDGSKKTYTVNINRKDLNGNITEPVLSGKFTLKSIKIDGYNLDFNPNVKKYELEVENDVDHLNVEAIASDSKGKVTITNPEVLVEGKNTIIIESTAENGSFTTYVVEVIKKSKAVEETEPENDPEEKASEVIIPKEKCEECTCDSKSNNKLNVILMILAIMFLLSTIVLGFLYLKKIKKEKDNTKNIDINSSDSLSSIINPNGPSNLSESTEILNINQNSN